MTDNLIIDDMAFELRRSPRRKTIGITVDRGGELLVSAPEECPVSTIEEFVHEKRFWIYTKLAEKDMLMKTSRDREIEPGEGFQYLGRSYRLKLVRAMPDEAPLRLVHGWFLLDKKEKDKGKEHFIRWYIEHAEPWIVNRMKRFKDRVETEPGEVFISDIGSRWGSCGKKGRLNFHWRVIMLPPSMVEYVIVHELVHLEHPHHTPEFWNRVERILPDFAARKQWLAENGASANI